jgi:hypothetical protein
MWGKLPRIYNADRQYADHSRPVHGELPNPGITTWHRVIAVKLYVHGSAPRAPVPGSAAAGSP